MNTNTLVLLLRIAGILHLGLIAAGALMPRVVNLRAHIVTLPTFIRRLFWVYYSFIGLCLVGFGGLTLTQASSLVGGTVLARTLCGFLAVFWTLRLVVATFVFDVSPYLENAYLRLGYHTTNLVFVYLPIVYFLAAWRGGRS